MASPRSSRRPRKGGTVQVSVAEKTKRFFHVQGATSEMDAEDKITTWLNGGPRDPGIVEVPAYAYYPLEIKARMLPEEDSGSGSGSGQE
jgi:hypothetical protein